MQDYESTANKKRKSPKLSARFVLITQINGYWIQYLAAPNDAIKARFKKIVQGLLLDAHAAGFEVELHLETNRYRLIPGSAITEQVSISSLIEQRVSELLHNLIADRKRELSQARLELTRLSEIETQHALSNNETNLIDSIIPQQLATIQKLGIEIQVLTIALNRIQKELIPPPTNSNFSDFDDL